MEPNSRQHPDIQKLNLNVKKLEEITIEALSGFFADKENPANARKRPYLNEIFKVAKQEERYKNDEIGRFSWPGSGLLRILTACRWDDGDICDGGRQDP